MMMTVYIIDDEAHAINTLKAYIEKTPELQLIGSSTDPVSALPFLTGDDPPMLLLLDVDMPGISGLELAGLLPRNISTVFITSFREFGVEAFELSAVDFLLKPISYPRFLKAVQKVKEEHSRPRVLEKDKSYLFVKGDVKEKYIKIVIAEIQFVRAALNYIEIHFAGDKVITYLTLAEILEELPSVNFCQTHRSYIVSRKHIRTIEKAQLKMENGEAVPIGGAYQDAFQQWLDPHVLVSKRIKGR